MSVQTPSTEPYLDSERIKKYEEAIQDFSQEIQRLQMELAKCHSALSVQQVSQKRGLFGGLHKKYKKTGKKIRKSRKHKLQLSRKYKKH